MSEPAVILPLCWKASAFRDVRAPAAQSSRAACNSPTLRRFYDTLFRTTPAGSAALRSGGSDIPEPGAIGTGLLNKKRSAARLLRQAKLVIGAAHQTALLVRSTNNQLRLPQKPRGASFFVQQAGADRASM
jgi:hypothetical protein